MSIVQDFVQCPQCKYVEAAHCFDCGDGSWDITCRRCGYYEAETRDIDKEGKPQWTHTINQGAGCLWYRSTGGIAFVVQPMDMPEQVVEVEQWLLEQLKIGAVENMAYLTRWNDKAKQVQMVLGEFYLI